MKAKLVFLSILAATLILVPAVVIAMRPQVTPYKGAPVVVQAPVASVPLNADTILNLVNNERVKAGLKPLVSDPRLVATAQAKADEMTRLNYFAHDNPATGKNSAWDNPIFNQICTTSSENISNTAGYADNNTQAVIGWMGSKAHHDAILRPDYTLTGVAVSGTKVVQHFCTAK